MLMHPEMVRVWGETTRGEAWRHMAMHIGHWDLRGFGRWAVILKSSGECIGRVGLWFPEGWPGVELGWMITPAHQGRGYATEAAREGLNHGFDALQLDRIISLISVDNARSIRVAEKLGGVLEDRIEFHGDTLVYAFRTPTP